MAVGKFIPRQLPPELEINDFLAQLQAGGVPVDQDALLAQAFGLIAQNMRIDNATSTNALTAGTINAAGIWLPGSITVTNIVYRLTTAGAGAAPTGMYVGLVDPHGDVIAVSNNLASSSVWTGVGMREVPLSAPVTLSDSEVGLYYAMLLQVGSFGTTQPVFARGILWGGSGVNGALAYGAMGTGVSALPAVGSQATIVSAGGLNLWVAVD
jgi:hypothetical protein